MVTKRKRTKRSKDLTDKIGRIERFICTIEKDIKEGDYMHPPNMDNPFMKLFSDIIGGIFTTGYITGLKSALSMLKEKEKL